VQHGRLQRRQGRKHRLDLRRIAPLVAVDTRLLAQPEGPHAQIHQRPDLLRDVLRLSPLHSVLERLGAERAALLSRAAAAGLDLCDPIGHVGHLPDQRRPAQREWLKLLVGVEDERAQLFVVFRLGQLRTHAASNLRARGQDGAREDLTDCERRQQLIDLSQCARAGAEILARRLNACDDDEPFGGFEDVTDLFGLARVVQRLDVSSADRRVDHRVGPVLQVANPPQIVDGQVRRLPLGKAGDITRPDADKRRDAQSGRFVRVAVQDGCVLYHIRRRAEAIPSIESLTVGHYMGHRQGTQSGCETPAGGTSRAPAFRPVLCGRIALRPPRIPLRVRATGRFVSDKRTRRSCLGSFVSEKTAK